MFVCSHKVEEECVFSFLKKLHFQFVELARLRASCWCTEIKQFKTLTHTHTEREREREKETFFPSVLKENERCYRGRQ